MLNSFMNIETDLLMFCYVFLVNEECGSCHLGTLFIWKIDCLFKENQECQIFFNADLLWREKCFDDHTVNFKYM